MPYKIVRTGKGKFSVRNIETGDAKSEGTSLTRARKQKRLLDAVDHGWKPTKSNKKGK